MENIFYSNRDLFINKGYDVVPAFGKAPKVDNWYYVDFSETKDTYFNNTNIGLKTGEASKVICIDIDILNKELQEKICKLLPPLFCGKYGNKDKAPSYFFSYNGEDGNSIRLNGDVAVELISTGRHTVLPPSIHPDFKYPYEWAVRSLLDIDIDELPELPKTFMNDVADLLAPYQTENIVSFSSGGRNDRLKQIAVSMITRGESQATVIDELYNYDKENHKPPLFGDPEEYRGKDPKTNAWIFVLNNTKSLITRGLVSPPERVRFTLSTEKPSIEIPSYKKYKIPKLRGIAQIMFEYIYDNSPIPRSQFAFASSISTLSTAIGNKIQYNGTFPNIYTMILGDSGSGKDFPLKFPIKAFVSANLSHYIGESMAASDTAIIQNLGEQQVRIDVVDEGSGLFASMMSKEAYLSNKANVYQELYTSVGSHYRGKTAQKFVTNKNPEGRLGQCDNPYINILSAMTISDFRECFNVKLMEKGLGGRFLYFIDDEKKKNQFPDEICHIPKEVIHYLDKTAGTATGLYDFSSAVPQIKCDPRSKICVKAALEQLDERKLKASSDSPMLPILNRLPQSMLKMAILDACSVQWEKPISEVALKKDNIIWSMKFIHAYTQNMESFINDNLTFGHNDRIFSTIKNVLAQNGGEMTKTDFQRNARIRRIEELSSKRGRDTYLNDMQNDELLQIITLEGKGGKKLIRLI